MKKSKLNQPCAVRSTVHFNEKWDMISQICFTCWIMNPSMLPNKPRCHLYLCCSLLGSTWSFMTRLPRDYCIMRRISSRARAFLMKYGETHPAACWKQRRNKARTDAGAKFTLCWCAGVLYMWCYSSTGRNLQFLGKSSLLSSVSYSGMMRTQLNQQPTLFGASGHLAAGFNELSCAFNSSASQWPKNSHHWVFSVLSDPVIVITGNT